ncbi:MAG: hypothetical protein J6B85_04485 [Lachnospiraceae bacterium]|nr:hypothetical protein [Lachnospiraceae bacterium]
MQAENRAYECDYLIMGQHHINNEEGSAFSGQRTEDPAALIQYVDQVIEGMETRLYTYIAHPDLLFYRTDMEIYRQEMERLCRTAKSLHIPLEINLLGLGEGRHYPFDAFWQIAAGVGCDVVIGCDAHSPNAIGNKAFEKAGCEYAARFGLIPLDTVNLVKPRL